MRRCLESLHSRRALVYRLCHGLETHDLRMKVLVQRMVVPVVAGVAFTAGGDGAAPSIRVNAAWGHGEAIASGRIDPDDILLDPRTGAVVHARIGRKRLRASCRDGHVVLTENLWANGCRLCLSRAHLRELCALLWAVHRFFGVPQDVEWCHAGERFWVVQSRPVVDPVDLHVVAADARICEEVEWTRANLVEVLPDVGSPQAVEANARLLDQTMDRWYGALRGSSRRLGPCVRRFCGRAVFNLTRLQVLCRTTGTDESAVLREMGHDTPPRSPRPQSPRTSVGNVGRLVRVAIRQIWVRGTAVGFADAVADHTAPDVRLDEQVTPVEPLSWACNRVQGASISSGQVEGEVVVVGRPEEFARMKPGAILVAPEADPSWIPLFTLASGVVLEVGAPCRTPPRCCASTGCRRWRRSHLRHGSCETATGCV